MHEKDEKGEEIPFDTPSFKSFYQAWCFGTSHSKSTVQRWKKQFGHQPQYKPQIAEFLRHASFASVYLTAELDRAARAQAHFCVGLIVMLRMELLLQFHLVLRGDEVKQLPRFKGLAKRRSLVRTITSIRLDDLYKLARQLGLFNGIKLHSKSLKIVETSGYSKNFDGALRYLRDRRNHVHPSLIAGDMRRILQGFPPDPSEAFQRFYFDFAAVAFDVFVCLDGNCQKSMTVSQTVLAPF